MIVLDMICWLIAMLMSNLHDIVKANICPQNMIVCTLSLMAYCKSRNIGLQEKLENLALGQNLNMVI